MTKPNGTPEKGSMTTPTGPVTSSPPKPASKPAQAPAQLSDLQKELGRYAKKLAGLKHIDAKQLGLDYLLPLLDLLARVSDETNGEVDALRDEIEQLEGDDVDLLAVARDFILRQLAIIDELSVAAGFFNVSANGLVDTGKLDSLGAEGKALKRKVLELGPDGADVIKELQDAIEAAEDQEDDDGEDLTDAVRAIADVQDAMGLAPATAPDVVSLVNIVAPVVPLVPTEVLDAKDAPNAT